jgi:hypothetical protein
VIQIVSIEILGESDRGPFYGSLGFKNGLQLVVAQNRFGKTLAFSSIAWCLGVEQIFGVPANHSTFFPDAVRKAFDVDDGAKATVEKVTASLSLEREDGSVLTVSRDIKGGESKLARVSRDGGENVSLLIGRGSQSSDTHGFQNRLRDWMGLPSQEILGKSGNTTQIYLENLAPLFLIEQIFGWSELQATQVYQYGIREVAQASVEYLLGARQALETRLRKQRAETEAAGLKLSAGSIAKDYSELMVKQGGWNDSLSTHRLLDNPKKWANLDLLKDLKDEHQLNIVDEIARITNVISSLNDRVNDINLGEDRKHAGMPARRVIEFKQAIHSAEETLHSITTQIGNQEALLNALQQRRQAANDLKTLKLKGIGHLPSAECPTCRREISPSDLGLTEHLPSAMDVQLSSLEQEQSLVAGNIAALRREQQHGALSLTSMKTELLELERALHMVTHANGHTREAIAATTTEIILKERERAQLLDFLQAIKDLERRAHEWAEVASQLQSPPADGHNSDDMRREFLAALRVNLRLLGCVGLTQQTEGMVVLNEDYQPQIEERLLRSLGSASDRARLVMAYALALLQVGLGHPGFVVLDEPIQQNPDGTHRNLLLSFYKGYAKNAKGQCIVFTHLADAEVAELRAAGVEVRLPEGRLLALVKGTAKVQPSS